MSVEQAQRQAAETTRSRVEFFYGRDKNVRVPRLAK
jgi:hypothetical protein